MILFALYPGWVISKEDGDEHYIGAGELMRLYRVEPHECAVFTGPESYQGWTDEARYSLVQLHALSGPDYRAVEERERERELAVRAAASLFLRT